MVNDLDWNLVELNVIKASMCINFKCVLAFSIRLHCIFAIQLINHLIPIQGPIVGHVGDGNFHCLMTMDPRDKDEERRVKEFTDRLAR